ncbi:MAG: 4Fe-4S binding protein [Promethearchaeota archaeon]
METSETETKTRSYFQSHKITILRRIVQITTFFFITSVFWTQVFKIDLSTFGALFKYVPFIESPRSEFSNSAGLLELILGSMVNRVFPFFVIGIFSLISIVLGRATCGWMCPVGLFQDVTTWLGEVSNYSRNMGITAHKILIRVKNFILFLILILLIPFLFISDDVLYRNYLNVLGDFGSNPLGFWSLDEFLFVSVPGALKLILENNFDAVFSNIFLIIQFIFYTVVILSSIYYPRMYCKYLCPYAALAKPIAKYSLLTVVRNPVRCVGRRECGDCEAVCPMQIRILDEPYNAIRGDGECILCGRCIEACDYNALDIGFFN